MATIEFTEQDANNLAEAIEAYGDVPHHLDEQKVVQLTDLLNRINEALDA